MTTDQIVITVLLVLAALGWGAFIWQALMLRERLDEFFATRRYNRRNKKVAH